MERTQLKAYHGQFFDVFGVYLGIEEEPSGTLRGKKAMRAILSTGASENSRSALRIAWCILALAVSGFIAAQQLRKRLLSRC